MLPDDDSSQQKRRETQEDGIEVPLEKINPNTLNNIISEFVTREWEEIGDTSCTLEDKIGQVLRLLHGKKAKIVFDLKTETCNIVPCDRN